MTDVSRDPPSRPIARRPAAGPRTRAAVQAERQAAALKANLARRKQQARAKAVTDASGGSVDPDMTNNNNE